MTRVIAALDNSPAARAVLATAGNLAELFDADVDARSCRRRRRRNRV